MAFNFKTCSRNVHQITTDFARVGDHQDFLLLSDVHWDNPHCNRDLLKRHLDEAVARDAGIIVIGALLCLMEGRADGRATKNVRPEHLHNYFDAVISTAAEWFEPYKDHLLVIGQGNHETAVRKHQETDMVERLCQAMRLRGSAVQPGGYSGFIRFSFNVTSSRLSQLMFYHHGYGGGGRTTRGTGHFAAYQHMVGGRVDIIASGHVHAKECFPHNVVTLSRANKIEQQTIHCVRLGTYKDEYVDGYDGWHVEKGRGPRPLGGYWLRFDYANQLKHKKFVGRTFTEAS